MFLLPSFRPGSCYETATTRTFYHGRTETMRPCTQEAVNWCKAMVDPTCEVRLCVYVKSIQRKYFLLIQFLLIVVTYKLVCQVDAKRKAMLLAFSKHNKLMAEAQEGKG